MKVTGEHNQAAYIVDCWSRVRKLIFTQSHQNLLVRVSYGLWSIDEPNINLECSVPCHNNNAGKGKPYIHYTFEVSKAELIKLKSV